MKDPNFDCLPLRVTQVGVNGKRRFDKEASFKKTNLLDRGLALLQPAIASSTQAKLGARSDIYGAIASVTDNILSR